MTDTRDFTIDRGEVWERLIMIKDRRTHRRRVPTEAAASLRIVVGDDAGDYILPCDITSEGGVMLSLSPGNTEWLVPGTYPWDMVVTVSRTPTWTETTEEQTVVVRGTLTVNEYVNITPLDSDGMPEPLEAVA